jgi:hypothetical protein
MQEKRNAVMIVNQARERLFLFNVSQAVAAAVLKTIDRADIEHQAIGYFGAEVNSLKGERSAINRHPSSTIHEIR